MRLLQSVLPMLRQTKKPQQKFLAHLLGLLLMLPGHATFRNLSRYSSYHLILKFFQVDITGMFRMTSSARYFKEGVGSSRPN